MRLLLDLLLIQFIFFSCKPSVDKMNSGDSSLWSLTIDSLLVRADSLSPATLLARMAPLPQAFQDSLFTKRLLVLETAENDNAIKTTLSVFKKVRPDDILAESLDHYYEGIFNQYAGKFDSADIRYTLATNGFEQIGAKYFLAQTLDKYSGCLTTQGHTDEAVAMKYKAITLLNELGYTKDRIKVQMHLANVFNLKGDFDQAISLLEEPNAFYEAQKDSNNIAYIKAMKGTAYISKKDYQNALLFHKEALAIRQKIRTVSGITESLFHVGRTLLKLGQWQEALDTLRVAENQLKISADKQGQAYIEAGLGEALFNLGRYEEADQYLIRSLDLSVKRKQYPALTLAAQRLSTVRKAQNRFAEALQYQEMYTSYRDSVFNQEKYKLSRELTVKYETREKELQIAALQQENILATQRNWWIGGSLILLAFIGLYTLHVRAAREQQRLEAENAKTEAQARLLNQQLEIHKLELDSNRIRLDDYAHMLIDRNLQLHALAIQLESNTALQDSKQLEDFENLFTQVILTEADWEKFQTYFNKVYPGLIQKLRSQRPDLTPAETRLVLLDKMGLSLKESSVMLGVSIDAVKKGRYRLKKKYQLEEDDLSKMIETSP